MNKLLTLKEIAKDLGVPESTLRKYREMFGAFIPSVGSGRSRRYKEEATEILSEIRNLREEMGLPWDAITDRLVQKYPMDGTVSAPPHDTVPAHHVQEYHHVQSAPPSIKASNESNGHGVAEKLSAMNEKQAMMLNAVAIELARSIENVGARTRKDFDNLRSNVGRAMETLYHAMSLANRREESLLTDIQKRLTTLEKEVQAAGELRKKNSELIAKMEKKTVPPAEPVKQLPKQPVVVEVKAASSVDEKRMADLKRAVIIAKEQIKKKDQALKEYKDAFEHLKKENTELKKPRPETSTHIAREHSHRSSEEDGTYEPRSSHGGKSFFARLFGK